LWFQEAISSGFDHYTKFDGRASRSAFWWWALFQLLVLIAAEILDSILGTSFIYLIAALALLLPSLSVSIRRLHDTGRSGWWLLIGLIPLIGFIVLLIFYLEDSDSAPNEYGPPPAGGVSAATA
jgi:uncharacterized membrane protein YhaH (DUF805 family)